MSADDADLLDEMNFFTGYGDESSEEDEEYTSATEESPTNSAAEKTTQKPTPMSPMSKPSPKPTNNSQPNSESPSQGKNGPTASGKNPTGTTSEGPPGSSPVSAKLKKKPKLFSGAVGRDQKVTRYLSPQALQRVKKDVQAFYKDPPFGIFIEPDEENLRDIDALVVGPYDTPYEGGFFHFHMTFQDDYPMAPPRVKFLTTAGNRVRFNPNLYSCGKVCLSLLGTWEGPPWTACQNISSLLVSLQSLLNEEPYFNEPGYDQNRPDLQAESRLYSHWVRYLTLKHAVLDNARDRATLPLTFRTVISDLWPSYYPVYQQSLEKLRSAGVSEELYPKLAGVAPVNDGTRQVKLNLDSLDKELRAVNDMFGHGKGQEV